MLPESVSDSIRLRIRVVLPAPDGAESRKSSPCVRAASNAAGGGVRSFDILHLLPDLFTEQPGIQPELHDARVAAFGAQGIELAQQLLGEEVEVPPDRPAAPRNLLRADRGERPADPSPPGRRSSPPGRRSRRAGAPRRRRSPSSTRATAAARSRRSPRGPRGGGRAASPRPRAAGPGWRRAPDRCGRPLPPGWPRTAPGRRRGSARRRRRPRRSRRRPTSRPAGRWGCAARSPIVSCPTSSPASTSGWQAAMSLRTAPCRSSTSTSLSCSRRKTDGRLAASAADDARPAARASPPRESAAPRAAAGRGRDSDG